MQQISFWKRFKRRKSSTLAVFLVLVCLSAWNLLVAHKISIALTTTMITSTTKKDEHRLRLDWSNLTVVSSLARSFQRHQDDCSLPLGNFKFRNRFGLGSDLHVWGQALCNALHHGVRIRTVFDWLWMDQQECDNEKEGGGGSPMLCYFPSSELQCPGDLQSATDHPTFDVAFFNISGGPRQGTVNWDCPSIVSTNPNTTTTTTTTFADVQRAAKEFLFARLSPHVVQEAERQHQLVFKGRNKTPEDLITVHIRWGDKHREMKLVPIKDYLAAIHRLLKERPRPVVNIYLATEDPNAVALFQQEAPDSWNVYVDQFYDELSPHRLDEYNGVPKVATLSKGRMGTVALGSLLVAMEANEFVLTTASNWSRLMNELRQGILDRGCENCTKMVDLNAAKQL
eukprot:scaffold154_cov129-Cylindrotheca_fusiformis.AAC.23